MTTIHAKDLTREVPRSPYDELAGIPWLPRLIDKVRALDAGMLGDYTPFPCGADRHFLGTTGLDPEALRAKIVGGASDEEVVAWVKANLPADIEERFAGYRQAQRSPLSGEMAEYLEGAKAETAAARPELDLSGVSNFAQLICVEEGHPLPQG